MYGSASRGSDESSTSVCFYRGMGDFCTYKAKRTSSGEHFDRCTNRNYVLTDYLLLIRIHKVCESMLFDSGPEVFVRVNQNYVLTEYVLNENDWISIDFGDRTSVGWFFGRSTVAKKAFVWDPFFVKNQF